MANKRISVVVLTYNAGRLIENVLDAIFNQSLAPREVIVIDSSSTDGTEQRVKKFPIRFYKIDKWEFGHGKTRNFGARVAKGEYVVFVTQDATPSNEFWLEELVKHLDEPHIAASFSRQIPRDSVDAAQEFFYSTMYPAYARKITKQNMGDGEGILLSNASSAFPKEVLLTNPFAEDILMSEDLEWALRLLKKNYQIHYASKSQVNHSHTGSVLTIFKRYFDFGVSHTEIRKKHGNVSFLKGGISVFRSEIYYLCSHQRFTKVPQVMFYDMAKFLGLVAGEKHDYLPSFIKKKFTTSYKEYWTLE
jgi:rhamnosyltransferase